MLLVVVITAQIHLCELDILLKFHYMIYKYNSTVLSRNTRADMKYILMLLKDTTPEQKAFTICR